MSLVCSSTTFMTVGGASGPPPSLLLPPPLLLEHPPVPIVASAATTSHPALSVPRAIGPSSQAAHFTSPGPPAAGRPAGCRRSPARRRLGEPGRPTSTWPAV